MTSEESTMGIQQETHGSKGEQCEYENCENEATTLVQFDETKPVQRYWFCAPHAGNSVQHHDDAHKIEGSG